MEIEGYENYLIYEDGRVFSKKRNKFLKPYFTGSKKYHKVDLFASKKRKCFLIHRLVALQYIPNPENKPQVDHINRDSFDNRKENLRWYSNQENCINKNLWKTNQTGFRHIQKTTCRGFPYWTIKIVRNYKPVFKKVLSTNKYTLEEVVKIRNEKYEELGIEIDD
jgi:hypothetical protein